jgi:ankyrin repeat protein
MSATPAPQAQPQAVPAPPPKNFQEHVVDSIVAGDLPAFRKLYVGKTDINRRLVQYKEIEYKPKYNPNERYISIPGPTMTMLAILCEQDEILSFILENKSPDLSVRVEGYTALHLAAMVKDYRPLQLLIQYQYIQENIDLPIELKGIKALPGDFTTALHAAVSNNRIPQLFLLLSEFPPYRKLPAPKLPPGKKGVAEPEVAPTEEEPRATYHVANVELRSAVGSPALYIATFLKNPVAVEILRAAGADPTKANAKGETSVQLAERFKAEAEERARKAAEKPGARAVRPDPSEKILALLTREPEDDLDVLKQKYAPELVPKIAIEGPEGDDDDGDNEPAVVGPESKASPKKSPKPSNDATLVQILDALKELSSRVGRLEREITRPGAEIQASAAVCGSCGAGGAVPCAACHRAFCPPCEGKSAVHTGCVD